MPDCVSTGEREWTDPHWNYVGAGPFRVRGGAGQVQVASAAYVFRRKFKLQYKCCNGADTRYVWVDGNYAFYINWDYDSTFLVFHGSIPLPIGGILGEIAGAAGAEISIIDWWIDAKEANAYKPAVDDSQAPNGRDALVAVPSADCGHFVTVDGKKIPWKDLEGGGDDGHGGVVVDPPPHDPGDPGDHWKPIWKPRRRWPKEMDGCCEGADPFPTLTVLQPPAPRVYKDRGSWYVDLKLLVSHKCGLKEQPVVKVYLFDRTHWMLSQRPVVTIRQVAGDNWELEVDKGQIAAGSYWGAAFRVEVHAVSKCEGDLDATYTVRRQFAAGEKVPQGGSGQWECTTTGQIKTLSGQDTLPACAGDWIYLGLA
jgi:hypothetical protein